MAVWAPDLHDDGDFYLPSDIFPDAAADPIQSSGTVIGMDKRTGTLRHPEEMELEWLLEPRHPLRTTSSTCMPPDSMTEGFRPEPLRGAGRSFGYGSGSVTPVGGGRQRSWMRPPMIAPEENVGRRLGNAGFIQRQQTQMHGHCYPLRRSGRPLGESSGTGVFIPCIGNNNPGKHGGQPWQNGMKNRGEQRRPLQQMRMAGLSGERGTPLQINEMGLPQDWTYSP